MYKLKYDAYNNLVITKDIEDVLAEFGFSAKDGEEILSMFVPTKPEYYHSTITPKRFKNTHLLSEAAQYKEKYGYYCPHPVNSQKHKEFWIEQKRRCLEGYTINKGTEYELKITGYHYWFLNFKKLSTVVEQSNGSFQREYVFPSFWSTHYNIFWAFDEAQREGRHFCILKSRGIGFSEIFSAIGSCNYTFFRENNFFYAFDEKKLLDDGVFMKVSDHLNYLNTETERAFKRLRTVTDQKLFKRAAKKLKSGDEKVTGGVILGKVVDVEHKARGGRAKFIMFEEAGSFKNLTKAINVARPSVEFDSGIVFGTIVAGGTGGSAQEYVEGLERLFYSPKAYNFKEFINYWDKFLIGQPCGFFAPCYATSKKYTDLDGNVDELRAYLDRFRERKEILDAARGSSDVDHRMAEFPFCPQEALLRQSISLFNQKEIQNQINYLLSNENKALKAWTNGHLYTDRSTGRVIFKPDIKAKRLEDYPLDKNQSIEGCISILESPKKLDGHVIRNLYTIGVDNYSQDQASQGTGSIGSVWVIKGESPFIGKNAFTNNVVAEYTGKPARLEHFWENVMNLAIFYNATIHFERRGGGQTAVDYFRAKKRLDLLEYSPEILSAQDKNGRKQYGMVYTEDSKWNAVKYLADWLDEYVDIAEDNDNEPVYIKRVQRIYSLGLLREISSFNAEGNFDRIDGLKNALMGFKNKVMLDIKPQVKNPWKEVIGVLEEQGVF